MIRTCYLSLKFQDTITTLDIGKYSFNEREVAVY